MKELVFELNGTEDKNAEQLNRQDLLMDCTDGDLLYIDSSHFCEDHKMSVITAWGEDIGILPVAISEELLDFIEKGEKFSLHISNISGEYGHLCCKVEVSPTFH
ncbi:MAG: hypothetical protein BM556_02395 [Bacteriovorax sp. MedPE-SWde]|nr:MAG: hypothetical protein BM556_02395 [Bacteriovorax sp. MedPE-SWde]